jgi:maltose-binding protein MalE
MEERKKGKTSSSTVTATITTTTKTVASSTIPTNKKLLQSNHKTIQSLYKNECVKAQDFVKEMVGSTSKDDGNDVEVDDDVASSPESCLELKMDSG